VSWQLASFGVLALALAGGFAWYERGRPDARVVALVGTLAAFAALGRMAFAALPNVKPTTDIVLISGYALGAAPGFVVGAIAALTSNFFFGQGPWTPWQMAAWGVTGLLGSLLALVCGRRLGRLPLALVCGAAGFAFTLMQDVGDWVNYSDHSAGQLGVYVAKGLGFDIIHAAGSVAFALAFGPPLARAIARFGARLDVKWELPPAGAAGALAIVALAASLTAAPARAAIAPARYLAAAQNGDGGFGPDPGSPSSQLVSGWAALGLAAAGRNPQQVRRGGTSVLDYIRAGAGSLRDPGSIERTILVLRAAGLPATSFAGRDLPSELSRLIRADGSVADQVNLTAFAIIALRAAGVPPPSRCISWLMHQQDADGGFNFATAGPVSDVDDTGAVLEALGAVGSSASSARLTRAISFIRSQQNRDGGMPSQAGGESNAQSTAWAVQGLLAAGVDPDSLHRGGAISPLRFLSSLVAPDGHIRYSRASDQTPVWVTAQAAMALLRAPLPLAPVALAPVGTSVQHPAVVHARHRPSRRHSARVAHRGERSARPAGSIGEVNELAVDAGVLMAVAFAPIGQ
jgi:energy-coupling factor transport system substrate-specific component